MGGILDQCRGFAPGEKAVSVPPPTDWSAAIEDPRLEMSSLARIGASRARRFAAAVLLGLLAAACTGPEAAGERAIAGADQSVTAQPLTCVLQAPSSVALAEQVVPVTFTLRNESSAAVLVLARQTPLEGFLGDLFEVTLAGRRLDYRGPVVKRGPPTESEFVPLAPGADAHATVDLLEGYDLAQAGRYTVRFGRADEFTCNELLIDRN